MYCGHCGHVHWSRLDSTVAERIRKRSLLLDDLEEYTNSSERSRICSATVESAKDRVHTLTEKRKAEKRKPIRTRSSSRRYISLVCFCLSVNSDWLPLFRFSFFQQGMSPAKHNQWVHSVQSFTKRSVSSCI